MVLTSVPSKAKGVHRHAVHPLFWSRLEALRVVVVLQGRAPARHEEHDGQNDADRREDPGDVRRLAFQMLGVHLGRAAKIVILADDVDRDEGDASDRPAQILPEFCEIRIGGLIAHRDRFLPETFAFGKEHGAELGEQFERPSSPRAASNRTSRCRQASG